MPVHPGDRIGRYVLRDRIGGGGMGQVWEAVDDHGRQVAIKFLNVPAPGGPLGAAAIGTPSSDGGDPSTDTTVGPALDEFTVPAMVRHPHIISVEDAGLLIRPGAPDVPWIAMEFVRGARTLTAWIQEERPTAIERLRLLDRVAEAIAVVHVHGVAHLDLKPANVLVDEYGHPRVVDFGIARRFLSDPGGIGGGTPGYASPEQSGRGRPDARADVWALGILLFEALAGRRLRPAGSADAPPAPPPPLAVAAPRLLDELPHLLPHLDRLIARCLQTHPKDRPENAGQVHRRLADMLDSHERPRVLGVLMREHPLVWLVGTRVAVVLVATIAAWAVAAIVTATTTAPVRAVAGVLPAPPGSVAAKERFDETAMVRIDGPARGPLPALPAKAGIDGPRRSPPPGTALRDQRPWLGAAIERLARAGAASIVVDIIFAPGNEDTDAGTRRLAAGIREAAALGVTTTIARRSLDGSDPLDPEIAGATPHVGHYLVSDGLGTYRAVDAAVVREQRVVGLSLAAAAVAARVGGADGAPADLDLGPDGMPRFDPQRPAAQRGLRLPPGMFSGSHRLNIGAFRASDGARPGDRTCFAAARMPGDAALEAATLGLDELFAADDEQLATRVRGRTVVMYARTEAMSAPAGPVQAVLLEDMLAGSTIRVRAETTLWLTLLAGVVGGGVAVLLSRRDRRRMSLRIMPESERDADAGTRATAGGSHWRGRRWLAGVLAAGTATAVVVLVAVPLAVSGGHFLHPLPPIVAGWIAAAVGASPLHPAQVLRAMGIQTHRPPSHSLTSTEPAS